MANGWTQIRANGKREELDAISAVMSMLDPGLQIEDYSDLDELILDGVYGDLIDEAVLSADRTKVSVSIYVPDEKPLGEYLAFIRERFSALGITADVETVGLSEEDWAENWKQYYHPIKIGRIVIVPAWEKYEPKGDEITVLMDPGMAFGTGTHETTRLVIGLLDKYIKKGDRVLDVGCGSGILSIAASKLGADACRAYDIDPVAVRVTAENIKDNGVENVECGVSDLLASVDRTAKYNIVCANIVADIIIRMTPDVGEYIADGGVLFVSGIIDERADEVLSVLRDHGYVEIETSHENGWCASALKRAKDII